MPCSLTRALPALARAAKTLGTASAQPRPAAAAARPAPLAQPRMSRPGSSSRLSAAPDDLPPAPKGFGEDMGGALDEDVEKAANALKFVRGEAEKALEAGFDRPVAAPAKLEEVFTLPEKRVAKEKHYDTLPGPKVFVGNLPHKMKIERDLAAIFKGWQGKGLQQIMPIAKTNKQLGNVNKYTRDKPCAGFAFLTFQDDASAEAFIAEWEGKMVQFGKGEKAAERTLRVSRANDQRDNPEALSAAKDDDDDNLGSDLDGDTMTALFVGNLPRMSGLQAILRRELSAPGVKKIVPIFEQVEDGRDVPMHRRRCRGFGYIFIDTSENAERFKAKFNGKPLGFRSKSGEDFEAVLTVEDAKKLTRKQKRALLR